MISGGDVVLRYYLSRALVAILFGGVELFTRLPNDPMLNIWLNIKNNHPPGKELKVGECHETLKQQPMHSYVCGINLRSESSPVLSDLLFALNRCTRTRQERVYRAKSKYDPMRILSELVFTPQT